VGELSWKTETRERERCTVCDISSFLLIIDFILGFKYHVPNAWRDCCG